MINSKKRKSSSRLHILYCRIYHVANNYETAWWKGVKTFVTHSHSLYRRKMLQVARSVCDISLHMKLKYGRLVTLFSAELLQMISKFMKRVLILIKQYDILNMISAMWNELMRIQNKRLYTGLSIINYWKNNNANEFNERFLHKINLS